MSLIFGVKKYSQSLRSANKLSQVKLLKTLNDKQNNKKISVIEKTDTDTHKKEPKSWLFYVDNTLVSAADVFYNSRVNREKYILMQRGQVVKAPGLGSKPTRAIPLCPWERHFYGTFPRKAILNFSHISIKLQADSNILVSPEAGRGNCLPYVLAPPSLSCKSGG